MKSGIKATAFVAIACLTAAVVPWTAQAQEQRSSAIRPVGKLDRMPADAVERFGPGIVPPHFFEPEAPTRGFASEPAMAGTIIAFPERRQLWQLFPFYRDSRTGIMVRNLDTLAPEHSFVHPGGFRRATTLGMGGEWLHATDGTSRLWLLDGTATHVVQFDLDTFAAKSFPIGAPRVVGPQTVVNIAVGGLTYDRRTDTLLLLLGGFGPGNALNTNTFLARLDPATGVWEPRLIRSCNGPLPSADSNSTYGMPVLPVADAVYVPCQRAGNVGAVVRLDRDGLLQPTGREDITIGPVYLETALADPVGERLFLVTILGEIWAFDAKSSSFIGVVASHANASSAVNGGYGLEEATGRVFFLSKDYGLGVAEGRFFPIPQARTLRSAAAVGQDRIVGDPKTGRVFVLGGVNQSKDLAYTVYDAGVAPLPPPPPDPDRNTADIDEVPGRTEAKYFASGGGYGARAIMAKGVVAAAPAPVVGVIAPTAQVISDNVNSKCGFTDRELVAGRVAQAQYDAGSSSAWAAAVDVDDRTKQDLEHLKRCDVTARNGGTEVFKGIYAMAPNLPDEGKPWRYIPASCSAGPERPQSASGDDNGEAKSLGTSRVECPEPGGRLHAEAQADLTSGAVKVGNAFTVVDIERPKAGGVVSSVVSLARDIDVAGVIHIGEIRSEAVSRATGRPSKGKTPMSTYRTLIRGVTIAGTTVCDGDCETAKVIDALNLAANGRAVFRASSGLDERLYQGSPKGSQTAVQKSPERQVSDAALVGDNTSEVPGLEMTVYNDNSKWGRARQVYQFAGVTSAANYNIVPLPSFADLLGDDEPSRPDGLDLDVPDGSGDTTLAIGLDGLRGGGSGGTGSGGGIVGAINRALRAVVDGFRLLVTDPRRAFLVLTAWAVLVVPVALNRRRRLLLAARTT